MSFFARVCSCKWESTRAHRAGALSHARTSASQHLPVKTVKSFTSRYLQGRANIVCASHLTAHTHANTHTHTHKHRDGLSIIGEIQVRVSVHVFACLWLCKSEVKISVREGDWSQIGLGCDGRSEVRVGSRPGTRTHQSFKRVWSRSVRKQYLFRVLFGATHPLVSASDSSANEFLTRQTQRPVPPPLPPPPPPSPPPPLSPHPPPQPVAAMASCQPLLLPSLAVPARALARVAAPVPVGQLSACRNRSMTCGTRNS